MTILEFKKYDALVKKVLTGSDLTLYNSLGYSDKEEYARGFIECIKEAKRYFDNKKSGKQLPLNQDNDLTLPQPDDGVRHWGDKAKSEEEKQNASSSRLFNDDEKEANDKGEAAKLAAMDASNLEQGQLDQQSGQQGQSSGLAALNAAQAAADAAQAASKAAQAAQQSAASNGTGTSGSAAKDAQAAAERAQAAALLAATAADIAENSTGEASSAAAQAAAQAAWDAGQAALDAAKAAAKARMEAEKANRSTSDTSDIDNWAGNQHDGANDQTQGTGQAPAIVTGEFGTGNDMYDPNMSLNDKMAQQAKNAGQPIGSEDLGNVFKLEDEKFSAARSWMSKQKLHGRGAGNSLSDVVQLVEALFESTVDWRSELSAIFNGYSKHKIDFERKRRKLGVQDPKHPWYYSKYIESNPHEREEKSGLLLVLILIDHSGSMCFATGKGHDVFDMILSEIIEMEHAAHIERSALTYFSDSDIKEDQIRIWNYSMTNDVWGLVNLLKHRVGDNGGGTSLVGSVASLFKLPETIFKVDGPANKRTTLIVVTDGDDEYKGLDEELDSISLSRTVFLVVNSDDNVLDDTEKILKDMGVGTILKVNAAKEW